MCICYASTICDISQFVPAAKVRTNIRHTKKQSMFKTYMMQRNKSSSARLNFSILSKGVGHLLLIKMRRRFRAAKLTCHPTQFTGSTSKVSKMFAAAWRSARQPPSISQRIRRGMVNSTKEAAIFINVYILINYIS